MVISKSVEESLSAGVEKNLRDMIQRGGNILIAQNRVTADLQTQTATPITSNIFDILDDFGLIMAENLVLDKNCGQVTISQNRGFFRMNSQVEYPFFPLVQNFTDHVTVKGLEQLRTLFTSEIIADTLSSDYTVLPLFYTSDQSTTVEQFFNLNPVENPAFTTLNQSGKLIAALSMTTTDSLGTASQMILVSDSRFLADDGGGRIPENTIFVMNAIDYLMGDSDLVELRSREITTRPLKVIEDSARARWKWINILLPSALVIAFGIFRWKSESKRSRMLEEMYE